MHVRSLALALALVACAGPDATSSDVSAADSAASDLATDSAASDLPTDSTASDITSDAPEATHTLKVCAMACTAAADCCAPGVADCPGAYPANWSCTDAYCAFGGCDDHLQCTFGGALPDYECHRIGGIGTCFAPCASDGDCPATTTCAGRADDGERYCLGRGGCGTDVDCAGLGRCDEGTCVCDTTADCSAPPPAPGGWGCRSFTVP